MQGYCSQLHGLEFSMAFYIADGIFPENVHREPVQFRGMYSNAVWAHKPRVQPHWQAGQCGHGSLLTAASGLHRCCRAEAVRSCPVWAWGWERRLLETAGKISAAWWWRRGTAPFWPAARPSSVSFLEGRSKNMRRDNNGGREYYPAFLS